MFGFIVVTRTSFIPYFHIFIVCAVTFLCFFIFSISLLVLLTFYDFSCSLFDSLYSVDLPFIIVNFLGMFLFLCISLTSSLALIICLPFFVTIIKVEI